ncbi:MAG: DUF5104 domain-containing protein [Firmicutes bacterium]|nr:DUF5104 domain-containing protein [Bacillota bacterium]
MKKKIIFFYFIAIVMLAGCTSAPEQTENANITEIQTKEAKTEPTSEVQSEKVLLVREKRMTVVEMCEAVLGAIQSEDREQLKALFCDKISATHDLDAELSDFYNAVDGKFVYFTDYKKDMRYGSESDKGTYVKYHISCRVNAETDTDKNYTIEFYANLVQDAEPDKIGVEYIVLKNYDEEKIWVGEFIGN